MPPQTNATCNTCGARFIAQHGHRCPPTTTHRTTTQYHAQRDESLHVNGIPVGHRSFTDQRNTSESVSSFNHSIHPFLQQPSTSSQQVPPFPNYPPYNQFSGLHHSPPLPQPTSNPFSALQYNPSISMPAIDQCSIRPIGDGDDQPRIWLRGGGGSSRDSDDGLSDFSLWSGDKKKKKHGEDRWLTFTKNKNGQKDWVQHRKKY